MIAGPIAGVATWLIVRRFLRRFGISDHKEMTREWMQWVAMAVAIVLLGLDAHWGKIDGSTLGQLILLIVGYTYFLTFVRRGDRVMLVSGLLMVAGSVAMVFVKSHIWTIMGIAVFVALAGGSTIAELTQKRADSPASTHA